jgi:GT2 family glycosyltransferase
LCWRLKNLGYKILFCPDSVVYHVGGGTLSKTSPKKTYLNFRNNLALICKNHPPEFILTKFFIRMVLDGIAAFKFLFSGQGSHFMAVVKAHFSFYRSLSKTLKKRKKLKSEITTHTNTAVYLHSIVADFYLRGKKTFSEIDLKERFK